jgi:hypothetical protein
MSKSGSRYGRRSNWFKIHCLLQEQANNNNNNNNNSQQTMLQNAVMYQNALQSFLPTPNKLPRLDSKKQGSIEELRSTPDSAASSIEDDSAIFLRNTELSSSPSPKSPFSEKEFLHFAQQRNSSPSLSPGSQLFLQQRLLYPLPFSAIKPAGLSPKSSPTTLDHLRLFGGRSHDFLNVPSLAGVAEDQNEPIDLSVKAKSEPIKTEDGKISIKSPLDLTKSEIPQQG